MNITRETGCGAGKGYMRTKKNGNGNGNGSDHGRREEDVEFGLGPIKVRAHGKTVTGVIFWVIVGGLLYWHDYKSDGFREEVTKALWVQTFIISHPEKERPQIINGLPEETRKKITQAQQGKEGNK